jgi:hypothetical protein
MEEKFVEDLEAIVVSVGATALVAEAALLEYAAGQPRDRKGRFSGTGGGGGGGGVVDPAAAVAQTGAVGGATIPAGVTINEIGDDAVILTGQQPKSGYAVATGVAGEIHQASDFFDRGKGVVMVDNFLQKNAAAFEKPQMHLGIWHEVKTGRVFLDVTEVFPANARSVALRAGRDRNQISIFNLRTFKEIPTGGDGRIGEARNPQGSREPQGNDGRGTTKGSGGALGADRSQSSAAPTRPPVGGTGQGAQAVAPKMTNKVREAAESVVDKILLEYAAGQPRDRRGRFGSTGSSGGGGGASDPKEYQDPTLFQAKRIDIVSTEPSTPTSPSTAGQIQTLELGSLPAAKASSVASLKTTEPKGTLSMHTTADGQLTAPRELLHTKLVSQQTLTPELVKDRGVVREDGKPTLVIMGGGGGSGKTTVLKKLADETDPDGVQMRRALDDAGIRIPQPALKQNEDGTTTLRPTGTAATINSDHAKHGIWGADGEARADRIVTDTTGKRTKVTAAARVHEESSVVAQRALEVGLARKSDIIFDGTGDGSDGKRKGIYDGAQGSGHETVGVFITTRIGTSPTDGIRGTVRTRNKKEVEIKTTDGTKVPLKRSVPDAVITDGHVKSNAAIVQGINRKPPAWDRLVVIERVPVIDPKTGKQGVYRETGQPDQPLFKYVVAATWDAKTGQFVETPEGRGVKDRVIKRGQVTPEGDRRILTNEERLQALDEAITEAVDEESIGTALAPVDYPDLISMWVEVLCGCEKQNSDVLRRNPQASQYWDDIVAEVAETPEDEVIDIPAEPSEKSAALQSIYPASAADFVGEEIPMGDDDIKLAEANMVLPPHANALYDAYETIAKRHGKWTQKGTDGANYVTESPYAYEGRMCSNCAFWVSPNGCEIVEGVIRPQGGCKLNIRAAIKESETEEKD